MEPTNPNNPFQEPPLEVKNHLHHLPQKRGKIKKRGKKN